VIFRVLSVMRKEFMHILRDRRTLAVMFLIPVIQLLLMGYAALGHFNRVGISVAGPLIVNPRIERHAARDDQRRKRQRYRSGHRTHLCCWNSHAVSSIPDVLCVYE